MSQSGLRLTGCDLRINCKCKGGGRPCWRFAKSTYCESNKIYPSQGRVAEVSGKRQRLLDIAGKFFDFPQDGWSEYLLLVSADLKDSCL